MVFLAMCLLLFGCKERGPKEATAETAAQPVDIVVDNSADMAPDFALFDQNGNKVRPSDHRGKIVVLEWTSYDCPFVKRHYRDSTMTNLASSYQGTVVWLAINSTHYADASANRNWVNNHKLSYPVLDDHEGKVGRLYKAKTTPHMFVIGQQGNIAYQGAIDNAPMGKQDADDYVNYVDKAIRELISRDTVSIDQATPYGCSVKYAD